MNDELNQAEPVIWPPPIGEPSEAPAGREGDRSILSKFGLFLFGSIAGAVLALVFPYVLYKMTGHDLTIRGWVFSVMLDVPVVLLALRRNNLFGFSMAITALVLDLVIAFQIR